MVCVTNPFRIYSAPMFYRVMQPSSVGARSTRSDWLRSTGNCPGPGHYLGSTGQLAVVVVARWSRSTSDLAATRKDPWTFGQD